MVAVAALRVAALRVVAGAAVVAAAVPVGDRLAACRVWQQRSQFSVAPPVV